MLGGGDTANRDIFLFGTMYKMLEVVSFVQIQYLVYTLHWPIQHVMFQEIKVFFVFIGFC